VEGRAEGGVEGRAEGGVEGRAEGGTGEGTGEGTGGRRLITDQSVTNASISYCDGACQESVMLRYAATPSWFRMWRSKADPFVFGVRRGAA
jgi:hypothetical protein